MTARTPQLPVPTEDLVKSYIRQFDEENVVVERTLAKLFELYPKNTAPEDVLLKVVAVNALYRTQIYATDQVADHIIEKNIDPLLKIRDPGTIDLIARIQLGGKSKNNYSFATKYCAWHHPMEYPIYDSFIEKMLWGYQKQDKFSSFRREALREYSQFKQIIDELLRHYDLSQFNFKDIDKFLWMAGKKYYPPSWEKISATESS